MSPRGKPPQRAPAGSGGAAGRGRLPGRQGKARRAPKSQCTAGTVGGRCMGRALGWKEEVAECERASWQQKLGIGSLQLKRPTGFGADYDRGQI